eukprot:m.293360 g.293360  ORF g.293360 m.293360 type:complete len:97 (+) comp40738_c0_seq56:133-423(+)
MTLLYTFRAIFLAIFLTLTFLDGFVFQNGTSIFNFVLYSNNIIALGESLLETVQVVNLQLSGNQLTKLPSSLSNQRRLCSVRLCVQQLNNNHKAIF